MRQKNRENTGISIWKKGWKKIRIYSRIWDQICTVRNYWSFSGFLNGICSVFFTGKMHVDYTSYFPVIYDIFLKKPRNWPIPVFFWLSWRYLFGILSTNQYIVTRNYPNTIIKLDYISSNLYLVIGLAAWFSHKVNIGEGIWVTCVSYVS